MSDTPKTPETALCPECGEIVAGHGNKRFCSRKCQGRFNNRMAAEGKLLAPLVKAMLATRGGGGRPVNPICSRARTELTRIARILNDADKAAGRPCVSLYVDRLLDGDSFYMDRRRLPDPPPTTGPGGWSA